MLKIDLEKAFDRLELSFVRSSLHALHFQQDLITLIMNRISCTTKSMIANGKPTNFSNFQKAFDKVTHSLCIYSSSVCNL